MINDNFILYFYEDVKMKCPFFILNSIKYYDAKFGFAYLGNKTMQQVRKDTS